MLKIRWFGKVWALNLKPIEDIIRKSLSQCVTKNRCCLNIICLFQIYADFDEIRQEIEAETERISGINKVL